MTEKNNKKKSKRYYRRNEFVWVIKEKKVAKIKDIDKENLEVIVEMKDGKNLVTTNLKLWEIDKLKYLAKKQLINKRKRKLNKVAYFASVNGGVIPTKDEENAGRDCYARIEPIVRQDGKEVYEMFLPKMKVSKIPLGFASYLDKNDLLSIKWERSSVGALGIINVSGLIDSTYQGEVTLQVIPLVHNVLITSEVDQIVVDEANDLIKYPYKKAIAQAVLLTQSSAKDKHITYEELLKKPSKRGTKGWGSTGK